MDTLAMEGRRFGRFGGEKERRGDEESRRKEEKIFLQK
jgi:hypothetical protein